MSARTFVFTLGLLAAATAATAATRDAGAQATARSAADSAAIIHAARIRAVADSGRYDEAEQSARRAVSGAGGREVFTTLGLVLLERGKLAAAESVFNKAVDTKATDALTAAVLLARLHFDRGERDRAMKEFDLFIDIYNNRLFELSSADLTAVGIACRYLGLDRPQLFKDALKAFDRAIALDPENMDARLALGELFLEKYNGADAQKTFEEALRVDSVAPRALLGMVRRLVFDGQPGADSMLALALRVNPNFVAGHVMRARQLLDIEQYADAQKEVERALAVNPSSATALATAAAIKYVTGDKPAFEALQQRALDINPHDAEFFATMAEIAGRIRLYEAAAAFARRGVQADAKHWHSHGLLGMNLLRLGRIDEAKKSLDSSFAGDPYDVWVKNTLDLLDTFKNYDNRSTEHINFMIEKTESQLLSVYLGDLAESAYATFAKRYAFTPPPPVRIEVYRSHADFSVRTVGLAGLGALGVSFGSTLAFDSPAAKDAGPFNWGSTVWHELAHTFTLGLTEHRVPRWLSEGLSVYEEHRAKAGWGFAVTPGFLEALRKGKLVPVSRMNDGFMRPEYAEQIQYSYLQASYVCELIARDNGDQALLAMLHEYKAGRTTDEVFQRVLKTDLKTFDKKFENYMRERFIQPLANLDTFYVRMAEAGAAVQRTENSVAIRALEQARDLFPEYAGENSPYQPLAALYEKAGDNRKAADALWQVVRRSESDYDAHITLARLLEGSGDSVGTAEVLDRAIYMNPFEITTHERLAVLYEKLGDRKKVVRERTAVVALDPSDKSDALYRLAQAHFRAGDVPAAKRVVMQALEEAPNFVLAQELLLTIVDGGKP